MAGIYFIVPKQGTDGYIGLDSNMSSTNFPRLWDHVYAAYRLSREYKTWKEGDRRENIQKCEEDMARQLCCNFSYRILLQGRNCYGLGKDAFEKFCSVWKTKGSLPEMNWAEICYIKMYRDKFAKLNDVWGGKYSLELYLGDNVDIGEVKFYTLVKKSKTIDNWYPTRALKTDEQHLKNLFFPYSKVVNDVINYYIDNYIIKDIVDTIHKELNKKSVWTKFFDSNSNPVIDLSVKDFKTLYDKLKSLLQESDYTIKSYKEIEEWIVSGLNTAIQTVFNNIRSKFKNKEKKGTWLGKKQIVISLPSDKFCVAKKEYPFWWPQQDAFAQSTDVTKEIEKIIPEQIFPYLVGHANSKYGTVGINAAAIKAYISNFMPNLTSNDNYERGFYFPARNLWLDSYYGRIDIELESGEYILIHRTAWDTEIYEKFKRSAFGESKDLKELTLW